MQDIYLKNYWLLNLEFVEAFSSLMYQNFPLSLLSNFYEYLDNQLQQAMMEENFNTYLTMKTLDEKKIQPQFERWLMPIRKPLQKKFFQGKLLLNFEHLRFSIDNYSQFDSKDTFILAKTKKENLYNIPVIPLTDDTSSLPHVVDSFIHQANLIFDSYKNHPAFNNLYLKEKFLADIPLMIEEINMIQLIFEKNLISSVIVGTTETRTSRILTLLASSMGIPSFCMQHGLIMREEAFSPVFTTKQIVYGDYEKDWYLKKGVEENRISIVGHPRFDRIFANDHMDKRRFCKILKINTKRKIVFIATQPFNDLFYVNVTEILIKNPDIAVVLKPHPLEKEANQVRGYIKLSKRHPSIKYVTDQVNLYDIIVNSDAVIVENSTVGLEAMLFNKPVIIYKSQAVKRNYPYYDSLDNLVAYDAEGIFAITHDILYNPGLQKEKELRQQFLERNYPQRISMQKLHKLIKELTG